MWRPTKGLGAFKISGFDKSFWCSSPCGMKARQSNEIDPRCQLQDERLYVQEVHLPDKLTEQRCLRFWCFKNMFFRVRLNYKPSLTLRFRLVSHGLLA